MAKLYFRYGAMNSGKSTALMQVAHNYEEQGMRVLILKPKVDTKGSGDLVSRLGVRRPADLLVPPDMDLVEAVRAASSEGRPLACVLCDESQFLTAEQAEQLFMVTVELNIPVICYGLRADFKGDLFPGSYHLLVLAARWIFLKDEYGMSSRYEIQYQMGIVGILLTFALVWSMCREKAQETEADKAKTRVPEKRAARTLLKVCMLAFTVLTVFGNAWTTRAEIRTAPYRKAYLQVSRELGRNYRTASDEDLETYLHNDPDAVRDAMRILEENHLNIFR